MPVRFRCARGPRDGMKRRRECAYGGELDLATLIWTRGVMFPLARLEPPSMRVVCCAL